MKVINNFLTSGQEDEFESLINSDIFPWFFYGNVIHYRDENFEKFENITETYAWIHTLYFQPKGINSEHYERFKVILDTFAEKYNLKITEILRVRIRRSFWCKGHTLEKYNYPHVDISEVENYKTLVYYFNDSDGDTILFKEKHNKNNPNQYDLTKLNIAMRNTPKKGTGLYFDGNIYHSGNCPVETLHRTVINFDFKIGK